MTNLSNTRFVGSARFHIFNIFGKIFKLFHGGPKHHDFGYAVSST